MESLTRCKAICVLRDKGKRNTGTSLASRRSVLRWLRQFLSFSTRTRRTFFRGALGGRIEWVLCGQCFLAFLRCRRTVGEGRLWRRTAGRCRRLLRFVKHFDVLAHCNELVEEFFEIVLLRHPGHGPELCCCFVQAFQGKHGDGSRRKAGSETLPWTLTASCRR